MERDALTTSHLLDLMLDQIGAWLIAVNDDWNITAWNETAATTSGYTRDDFSTLNELLALLVPDEPRREAIRWDLDRLFISDTEVVRFEIQVICRDGHRRVLEWTVNSVPEPSGAGQLAVGIGIDQTSSRTVASQLQRNEAFHRALLENLQEGIWWIGEDGRTRYANAQLAHIVGVHSADLVGRKISDFLEVGETLLHGEMDWDVELRRSDCSIAHVHITGGPVSLGKGGRGTLLSVVDTSQWHQVREQYALLAAAVNQTVDGILIASADMQVQYANPAFSHANGAEAASVIGADLRQVLGGVTTSPDHRDLWETVARGECWNGRLTNRSKDGSERSEGVSITPMISDTGAITNYICVRRDVTEQLELQAQAETNQRLQAIGTLAGGIAHDFNNILMAILGYATLASAEVVPDSALASHLEHIAAAAHRARELADDLLTFSRGADDPVVPVDITRSISDAARMLRATIPASVAITTEVAVALPPVLVGVTQMTQVVMNLGLNAAASIPAGEAGSVTISTRTEHKRDPHSDGAERQMAVIEVRDTGCGMDDATLSRVFEPFFSTRPVGEGTGMGLAVVHGIVYGAGGFIDVSSAPGRGSTFTVCLPACAGGLVVTDQGGDGAQPTTKLPLIGDGRKIMVVDDEPALVDLLTAALEASGFRTEGFGDPARALAAFQEAPRGFDAVVTDVTMPQIQGDRLALQITSVRPDLPVIGYTGYSSVVSEEAAAEAGMRCLLRKPLDLTEFAQIVLREMNREVASEQCIAGG